MKIIRPTSIALTLVTLLFALFSCEKLPETSFTYTPIENPEAGEDIQFENTTSEASSFSWDFGDGESSIQENPVHKFDEAGSFEVILTATNEDGSQPKTETITIGEATILVFQISDSTEINLLDNAEVWLYDKEADWDNFEEPLLSANTDVNGEVVFSNMEAIEYYIWVIQEETGGFWFSGGSTPPLAQNETSVFSVPCIWIEDDETKATVPYPEPLKLIRR